ncbi:PAS domain S-box protein [Pedobacter cryophilus]|uniref:histidine kinase n=1 Tax=Pedobacter cryophilus TaxID=2571271 RepID=A0A4U1BV48_9SPHI|nr:PAS domain S-box protein [Pedobacter cryophilus]TKB95981.1 PAS domain S-box protein [Pedobacter cryophilus]
MENNSYFEIFKLTPTPSLLINANYPIFTIVAVNIAYLKVTEKLEEDLIGKGIFEAFPENPNQADADGIKNLTQSLKNVIKTKLPDKLDLQRYDIEIKGTNNYEERYCESENIPVLTKNGDIEFIIHTITNVTELILTQKRITSSAKEIEKSKELLDKAEIISKFGSWEVDLLTNQLFWSDGVYRMCGYEPTDFEVTFEKGLKVIHPDDRALAVSLMENTIKTGIEYKAQKRLINKNNEIINVISRGSLVKDDFGNAIKLIGVFQDITDQIKANEEIILAKDQFESLIHTIDGIVWEADAQTFQFNFVSPQVENILGYTPTQWLSEPEFWQNHLVPEDKEEAISFCHIQTSKSQNHTFEYRMIKADGSIIWLRDIVTVITKDGIPIKLRGIILDISSRKLLEIQKNEAALELKKRNTFIETALENLPIGIAVNNLTDGTATLVNDRFSEIYGWPAEELKDISTFFEKVYPDETYRNKIIKTVMDDIASGDLSRMNWKGINITTKNGEQRIINAKNIPVYNQDLMISTVLDVTEETLNFRALESTKDELSKIMNSSLDIICTINEDGCFVKVSAAALEIWGYHPDEITGTKFLDLVYPDDCQRSIEATQEIKNGTTMTNFQNRYVRKNGTIAPMVWSARWDNNEKLIYCVAKDGTEKLLHEQKLLESETNYKTLFENNPIPMLLWDFNTLEIFDCNEEALIKYGYTREEFLKLNIRDIRPPEDLKLIEDAVKSEASYGLIHKRVWRHLKKNGELMYVDISGHLINYNGRRASINSLNDITDKLKAEELKEFEKRDKEALINSTDDLIWSVNKELRLIVANNAANENSLKRFNAILQPGDHLINTFDVPQHVKDFWFECYNLALTGKQFKKEIESHDLNRENVVWIEINFNPIYNKEEVIGVACFVRNITEKKLAEELIKQSEANLAEAQKLAKLGSWNYNVKTDKLTWSEELYNVFGTSKQTFIETHGSFVDLIDEEDKEIVTKTSKHTQLTGEPFTIEYHITTPTGEERVIQEFGYGEKDDNGKVIRLFGTAQDITERKRAEKLILESEVKYRSIVESSMDGILLTIKEGDVLSANSAACEIFNMTEEEICNAGRTGLVDITDPRLIPLLEERNIKGRARGELIFKRKNGANFPGEITSVVFKDAHGQERTSMIIRDITAQKNAENTIKENNQRFEYVTKATSDAIWDWNLKDQEIYWGEGYKTIFGYDLNDLDHHGNSWTKKIHPDDLEKVLSSIQKTIDHTYDSNWYSEYRYLKADGNYAFVQDKGIIIRDNDKKAIRIVGAMQDITKKKKEDERLKLLESVVTYTNDAVLITEAEPFDAPGPRILYVNEAFTKMTGYLPEDVIGKTPRMLQGPKSDREELNRLSDALRNWESCEITTINYKKNGDEFWINFTVTPVANDKGWYTHWVAIERDVTEQIIAQKQLESAYEERNTILESIGDAFFAIDKNWVVTYWNYQAEKMLGTPKEIIFGKNLWDVFSESINSVSFYKYHEALETKQVIHFEDYYEQQKSWYEISVYPSDNGLSVYFKDITERKIAEIQLLDLNQLLLKQTKELAISNQELEQFAYVASHDLQEPLRMITSFLSQIEKKYGNVIDDKGKQYIYFAVDGAKRMRQIILDLLEFSRVGRTPENLEEIDVKDLIIDIKSLFRKQIEETHTKLTFKDFPLIKSYKTPIRQVLQNLISNALKYHNKNTTPIIQISVEDKPNYWEFCITDNGIGIDQEYFKKIFIIFQRLHNKDEYSGTGMGLAICKKIIENLGGEIWVDSEEGKGSTFYFTIKK